MVEPAADDTDFRPVADISGFFDWASTAPLSSACVRALADFAEESAVHPAPPDFLTDRTAGLDALRDAIRSVFGVGPDADVALVRSVSEASSALARALPLPASCDVVVTAGDHAALTAPWCWLAGERNTVRLITVPCKDSGLIDLDRAEQLITARTAVVACTHVTHLDGVLQPVAELAALVKRKSRALVVLDAAQSVGRVRVDFDTLGADILIASGRKALLSPLGTGFLIAAPGVLEEMSPMVFSPRNCEVRSATDGAWQPGLRQCGGPSAFEGNLPDLRSLHGLLASLTAYRRAGPHLLADRCRTAASLVLDFARRADFRIAGQATASGRYGIVRLRSPRVADHRELKARIAVGGFSLAAAERWLRISVHAFTTTEDIAGLFDALTPFGLRPDPVRRTL
ncbi:MULTISPECIES: aminotransferase class V-fold PLP-dependent enzyme [unclassified Streptomyces]|uniref:aminotransferase class V-fold PLP-dependent enzyme n=1 Tax=unclassified Streptomyces TaxID=2593676 RepID=UPI00403C1505